MTPSTLQWKLEQYRKLTQLSHLTPTRGASGRMDIKKAVLSTLPCIALGMAVPNNAFGAIVTRDINQTFNAGINNVDIDGDGMMDIRFGILGDGMAVGPGTGGQTVKIHHTGAASPWFHQNPYSFTLMATYPFLTLLAGGGSHIGITYRNTSCTAPWFNDGIGFLGIQWEITPGQFTLGWIAMEVSDKQDGNGGVCIMTTGALYVTRQYKIIKAGWESVASATAIAFPMVGQLPVELTNFAAFAHDDNVHVSWNTLAEVDNAGFEIQRSENGVDFEAIGWVDGQGSSSDLHEYNYRDTDIQSGKTYYYRLKQVDFDGSFEYSDVAVVLIKGKSGTVGDIFPNPSRDGSVQMDIDAVVDGTWSTTVFDVAGREITSQPVAVTAGTNRLDLDYSDLDKGTYFVKFEYAGDAHYRKLIIQ